MGPDRLPHRVYMTLTADTWEASRLQNMSSKPIVVKKGSMPGNGSGSCKKRNCSPNKVRRSQTKAQSYNLSTIDKAHFEEVSHRECANKLKNLSLVHKDRNSKKTARNTPSPVRKGSFLLRASNSTAKKAISGHSTEVHLRNTKSAANLKQPSRSSASQGTVLQFSMAIRDSPSNVRPMPQILSAGCAVLESLPFDTEESSTQQAKVLSTHCHNSDCHPPTNPLFWSFELPATVTDADEDSASDLSDSERIPFVPTRCKPPDLKLRAEVIAPAELACSPKWEHTSSCFDFNYPDFLPPPFASWNLRELSLLVNTGSNTRGPITAQPLGLLESLVGRLLDLEWLQLKTVEVERGKSMRPRPNTAPGSCVSARNPGRGKKACLVVSANKLLASPGDLATDTVCSAASFCSHCQLHYPYCNGTCRPYMYQNYSRTPSAQHHGTDSLLKAFNQPRARGKEAPSLSTKEVVLGRGSSDSTPLCCATTVIKAKTRKQPSRPGQCPPAPSLGVLCPPATPHPGQCPPASSLVVLCPPAPSRLVQCPPASSPMVLCPPAPSRLVQCPPASSPMVLCPPAPSRLVQCPPASSPMVLCPPAPSRLVQCPPAPPRPFSTHQVTDTKKMWRMDESIVLEKGICLDRKTQRNSNSSGKARRPHTQPI
uniref:uncharacterized protein n=1 Tax=Pristiophorus japonicus TaxID=55135 RepID=UPI00398F24E9